MGKAWRWIEDKGRTDHLMLVVADTDAPEQGETVVLCANGGRLLTRDPEGGVLVPLQPYDELAQLLAAAPEMRALIAKCKARLSVHLARHQPVGEFQQDSYLVDECDRVFELAGGAAHG